MDGIYLTWMISALALGVILLPVFKPPWMELRLTTFVDFFRRYWIHILMLFMISLGQLILIPKTLITITNVAYQNLKWKSIKVP